MPQKAAFSLKLRSTHCLVGDVILIYVGIDMWKSGMGKRETASFSLQRTEKKYKNVNQLGPLENICWLSFTVTTIPLQLKQEYFPEKVSLSHVVSF